MAAEWQKLKDERRSIKKQRKSSRKAREDGYIEGFKKARAVVIELLDLNVDQMILFGPESGEDE